MFDWLKEIVPENNKPEIKSMEYQHDLEIPELCVLIWHSRAGVHQLRSVKILGPNFIVRYDDDTYDLLNKDGSVENRPGDKWYKVDEIDGLTNTAIKDRMLELVDEAQLTFDKYATNHRNKAVAAEKLGEGSRAADHTAKEFENIEQSSKITELRDLISLTY